MLFLAASIQRAPRRRLGITFLAPAIDSGGCCTWRASRRCNLRLRMSADCSIITVVSPPSCAEAQLEQPTYHLGNSNERVANSKPTCGTTPPATSLSSESVRCPLCWASQGLIGVGNRPALLEVTPGFSPTQAVSTE